MANTQQALDLKERIKALEEASVAKDAEIKRLSLILGIPVIECCSLDITSATRENLDEPRAKELLADAFKGEIAQKFNKIRFGTKSFGKEASIVAAEAIKNLVNLEVVDLADIIAGRPEEEALEVLKTICGALSPEKVRVLDLSDNALGEKGVRALEPVLRGLINLEEMYFHNNGLSELSLQLLSEYLPTQRLKTLSFHNNMSGDGGAAAIAALLPKCPVLTSFRMSSSRVRCDGGVPLIDALSNATNLTTLNLSDSMFGEEAANNLSNTLRGLNKLTSLSLRDSGLEEGTSTILEVLADPSVCPCISDLDISIMEIQEEQCDILGRVFDDKKTLEHINLEENELETAGAIQVAKALGKLVASGTSNLKTLNMKANQIGQQGALALARFAASCTSLTALELDDNQISEAGVEKVRAVFEQAGKPNVLGSLEENDPEGDEDDEMTNDEEDELAAMFRQKVGV